MSDERRRQPERRQSNRGGGRRATDPPVEWLSITDYATVYGVSRTTVYKWLKAGLLETYQRADLIRIRHRPPTEMR